MGVGWKEEYSLDDEGEVERGLGVEEDAAEVVEVETEKELGEHTDVLLLFCLAVVVGERLVRRRRRHLGGDWGVWARNGRGGGKVVVVSPRGRRGRTVVAVVLFLGTSVGLEIGRASCRERVYVLV